MQKFGAAAIRLKLTYNLMESEGIALTSYANQLPSNAFAIAGLPRLLRHSTEFSVEGATRRVGESTVLSVR